MTQTVETFICKNLGIEPQQLLHWRVTSEATNRGRIENFLIIKTTSWLSTERAGSLVILKRTLAVFGQSDTPTTEHEATIVCLMGKETNKLFQLLYKTMACKLGN